MSCFSGAWEEVDEALVIEFHVMSFLQKLLSYIKLAAIVVVSMLSLCMLLQHSSSSVPSTQGAEFAILELLADSGWFNGANQSLSYAATWLKEDIFKSAKLQP
uniref:Uncharacterized protein n=1 Tax=Guillardia theta TaxID=55529 RepID=A0A7S4PNN1_GUITH|mmetsp:Transcript_7736/g.26132  ORF Transcript_7736/g.26132 Transcript_7736/m.26132 type:complete len:103 (+) Transcript_7736:410-718(+)